jgi:anthranilate synthase component 1
LAADEGQALSLDGAQRFDERFPVAPVTVTAPARGLDAVTAFRRIAADGRGFILEGKSYEAGEGRYAYVGAESDSETLLFDADVRDPLPELRSALARLEAPRLPGLPEFVSGAVGYMGYEAIQRFEPSVAPLPADPAGFPLAAFFLPKKFLAFDRHESTITAVALARTSGARPEEARKQALHDARDLLHTALTAEPAGAPLAAPRLATWQPSPFEGDTSDRDGQDAVPHTAGRSERRPCLAEGGQSRYEDMVRRARHEIERGELIQVVLSQRVERPTSAPPLAIYEQLRDINPSTYMFMLNFGDFALAGASPELMVRSRGGVASIHPIAGTRPRGETPEEDAALEAELLVNEKERAEHVMLVDLARNDLGRVSQPGTVRVGSFMATERYSHVMHLVSRVTGRLRDGMDGLDAFVAGFPIGTLSGAPRLRAVELIAELERDGRGPYCGGVGWFGANGDIDTGTVIRSVALKDGVAHVQGGGGIVFDSDPEREYFESLQKMKAPLKAIELAERACDAELDPAPLVTPSPSGRGLG